MDYDTNQCSPDSPIVNEEASGTLLLDHHLSYNALKGSSGLIAMRLCGTINGMIV